MWFICLCNNSSKTLGFCSVTKGLPCTELLLRSAPNDSQASTFFDGGDFSSACCQRSSSGIVCWVTSSGSERMLEVGDEGGWISLENAPKRVLTGTSWRGRGFIGSEVNWFVREGMFVVEKRVFCSCSCDKGWKRYETSPPVAKGVNSVFFPDIVRSVNWLWTSSYSRHHSSV